MKPRLVLLAVILITAFVPPPATVVASPMAEISCHVLIDDPAHLMVRVVTNEEVWAWSSVFVVFVRPGEDEDTFVEIDPNDYGEPVDVPGPSFHVVSAVLWAEMSDGSGYVNAARCEFTRPNPGQVGNLVGRYIDDGARARFVLTLGEGNLQGWLGDGELKSRGQTVVVPHRAGESTLIVDLPERYAPTTADVEVEWYGMPGTRINSAPAEREGPPPPPRRYTRLPVVMNRWSPPVKTDRISGPYLSISDPDYPQIKLDDLFEGWYGRDTSRTSADPTLNKAKGYDLGGVTVQGLVANFGENWVCIPLGGLPPGNYTIQIGVRVDSNVGDRDGRAWARFGYTTVCPSAGRHANIPNLTNIRGWEESKTISTDVSAGAGGFLAVEFGAAPPTATEHFWVAIYLWDFTASRKP